MIRTLAGFGLILGGWVDSVLGGLEGVLSAVGCAWVC